MLAELVVPARRAADLKVLIQELSVDSLLLTGRAPSTLLRRWIDADLAYDPANHRELLCGALRGRFMVVEHNSDDHRLFIADIDPGLVV